MEFVFLLWHVQRVPKSADDDEKLIGAYRTEEDARAAILRLKDKPGFSESPTGFEITKYELNKDNWTEGYVSA
jgi:coenzyme PQQ precursor peptide PqqA